MANPRKVSPGLGGAVSDAYSAVKDYVRATREGSSPTRNASEDNQLHDTEAGSDDASHSSYESSTAGRTAQSTDHMNQY